MNALHAVQFLLTSLGALQLLPVPSLPAEIIASPATATQPFLKTPVDTFRELLAMTPAERKQFLAARPPDLQKQILAKVRQYESLNANQRELRLKVTELYYYLWPLMNSAPTNRAARLAVVPELLRHEIEERLQKWDDLSPGKQQELLTNAATARYFAEVKSGPPPVPPVSPAQQEMLQHGIRQWQALPADRQEKIMDRFYRFFDLSDEEKARALSTLSEAERRQIRRTLARFENLTPADRAECLRSFERFASLTLAERQQFLKNAERWKLMVPDEREDWRKLVKDFPLSPPPPPGLKMLPAPPGWSSRPLPRVPTLTATNRH